MCAHWNKIEIIFSFSALCSLLEIKMALYTVIVRCSPTSIIQHFWKALSISSTYIRLLLLLCFCCFMFFFYFSRFSAFFLAFSIFFFREKQQRGRVWLCVILSLASVLFIYLVLLRFLFFTLMGKNGANENFMSVRCFCFNWFLVEDVLLL